MNTILKDDLALAEQSPVPAREVYHFVRGKLVRGQDVFHKSRDLGVGFTTPKIDLNALVHPRSEAPPLLDFKLSEIIEFLIEAGKRLRLDDNIYLQESLERVAATSPLPRHIIENLFDRSGGFMTGDALMTSVTAAFPNPAYLDGWVERTDSNGQTGALRAFPPRLVHMLAGNSPASCISSIAQGALVKGINIFKMPSTDPFSTVAVLRTMADIDPNHPVVRSMSAVYWRGGDETIERTLYRPQYIDKIVAWGGGDAINSVMKYLMPGLQLISFDPKTSISIIGKEGLVDEATIDEIAEKTAADATIFNQDACLASRFVYIEGDRAKVERYCAKLVGRLGVDRMTASEVAPPLPVDLREEIEVLQMMGGEYRVWGKFDGRGIVVLSDEPVEFHPIGKTVNVVHVPSLDDAVRYVNVATQTIGVYPDAAKTRLRDRLASAGGQRVVRLGSAMRHVQGGSHDAMFPLQRLVHWMGDENA